MANYAAQLGVRQALPSLRCQLGPYLFRADFDSANLESVRWANDDELDAPAPAAATPSPAAAAGGGGNAASLPPPSVFHAWLSSDPCSTYRVWFHFSVAGGSKGRRIHVVLKNMNNKKPLIGEGMYPVCRLASQHAWKRVQAIEFTTLKTEKGAAFSFLRPNDDTTVEGSSVNTTGAGEDDGEDGGGSDEEDAVVEAAAAVSISAKSSPAGSPAHSRQGSTAATAAAAALAKKRTGSAARSKGGKKIRHDTMELTIKHTFESDEEVFFAFCLPHSYTQLQAQLLGYDRKFSTAPVADSSSAIYYHRELLIHSLEGRRVDLLTISSTRGLLSGEHEPQLEGLYPHPTEASKKTADVKKAFPHDPPSPSAAAAAGGASTAGASAAAAASCAPEPRCGVFPASKPIALFSARVHPGESPSAYMLNGLLEFLLGSDPRAAALRDACVIKIIPCLNPDGLAHGYYRTDTLGQNLNRFYAAPVRALQPSIYATRCLVSAWHQRGAIDFYLDLHAHAMKRGLFLFGNHLADDGQAHARNISYAKLVELNSPYLSMAACNFTAQNMSARDARDGLSKEGAGRVAFYQLTGIRHCYTCEVNYHNGRAVNQLAQLPEKPTVAASSSSPSSSSSSSDLSWQRDEYLLSQDALSGPPVQYGAVHFQSMGRSLAVALLDLREKNPFSRIRANAAATAAAASSSAASSSTHEFASLRDVDRWSKGYAMAPPKRLMKKLTKPKAAAAPNSSAPTAATTTAPAPTEKEKEKPAKSATPKLSPKASPRARH